MMSRIRPLARAAAVTVAVLAATACERAAEVDRSPITVTIHGDSLRQMAPDDAGAGVVCEATFRATTDGPEGEHAVLRGGRVRYWWWTTGVEAATTELDQRAVHQLWVDSILPVGQDRMSHAQGFGQSSPAQPVRGEVTFSYGASNSDEVSQTEPFRFYCY